MARNRFRGIQEGYRSGLEQGTAANLTERGVSYTYEEMKIKWLDTKTKTYTPDFVLENGIIVETKGRFTSPDRSKHLRVKEQYPELDIRFVFTNSNQRLYKGAKSSYADWCKKNSYLYADKIIPQEWLDEKGTKDE